MKSIIIQDLDEDIRRKIHDIAKKQGLSVDELIKKILREALQETSLNTEDHREDFIEFLGVWSEEDKQEFEISVQDFEKINSEDWE